MKTETPILLLDTHALLAYLNREPAGAMVKAKLKEGAKGDRRLLISAMSICEVCYLVERRQGLPAVDASLSLLESLPVEIVDIDRPGILGAARVKARYPMSLGDAFVAALALERGATVVTGDKEFKQPEGVVPVLWLGQEKSGPDGS